jgi:hypothetical protein
MATAPRMFETGEFRRVDPSTGFDELNAPLPAGFNVYELGAPVDVLPGPASKARLVALRQRALDLRAVWLPLSDELRDVRLDKQKAEVRLRQLKLRRGEGGPELADDDWQVVDARKKLARFDSEIERLTKLEQARGPAMHSAGMVLRACEDWLRRGGALKESAAIDVADVVKKGERLTDAIERVRHRLRELDADAHRIRSAAYPAAHCKQKLREQIENLAMRGVPDVSALIEHNTNIGWPMAEQVLPLVAINKDGSIFGNAQGETVDTLAMFAWLNRQALLKAIDALIDGEADDGNAISVTDREAALNLITRDRLVIELQEAAIVWHGQSSGENVEHRSDASPLAVLGVEVRTGS